MNTVSTEEKYCDGKVTIKWHSAGDQDTSGRFINVLDSIIVDPEFRGQGLVREALEQIDDPDEENIYVSSVTEFLVDAFLENGWKHLDSPKIGWIELKEGVHYNEERDREEKLYPMIQSDVR